MPFRGFSHTRKRPPGPPGAWELADDRQHPSQETEARGPSPEGAPKVWLGKLPETAGDKRCPLWSPSQWNIPGCLLQGTLLEKQGT